MHLRRLHTFQLDALYEFAQCALDGYAFLEFAQRALEGYFHNKGLLLILLFMGRLNLSILRPP